MFIQTKASQCSHPPWVIVIIFCSEFVLDVGKLKEILTALEFQRKIGWLFFFANIWNL